MCVSNAFDVRAGFDMNASHIFLQVVLTAITFLGGWAGNGGTRACAVCEVGLPFFSVAITALSGAGSDLKLLEGSPEGQPLAASVPLKCVPFLLLIPGLLSQRRGVLYQMGPLCLQRSNVLPV